MKTYDRDFDSIEVECDECGLEYIYDCFGDGPDFKGCQEEIKSAGWISRTIDGEWHDFCCQECYDKFKKQHLQKKAEIAKKEEDERIKSQDELKKMLEEILEIQSVKEIVECNSLIESKEKLQKYIHDLDNKLFKLKRINSLLK